MTDTDHSAFHATDRASDQMFELLEATNGDVVAVRVGAGTSSGYRELYDLLVEKTEEYGTVHVYEEGVNWPLSTYLSHLRGIVPDLREGPKFNIGRYAAVGDSRWLKLLYVQWAAIAPLWPVSPDRMRHYPIGERRSALEWVTSGGDRADISYTEPGDGR